MTYGPHQNGNVHPKRVVTGSQTQIATPNGIAASSYGFYVANSGAGSITRYALNANGDVPPRSVLKAPAYGGIFAAPDDSIYLAGRYSPEVYQYAPTAKRHDAPLTTISGSNTGLVAPTFVFVN